MPGRQPCETAARLPIVLSRDEVRAVLGGAHRLMAGLLYSAGLWLMDHPA